jgi:hypothetical protein
MIQTEPEELERIRERLRKMSDLELRKYGRAARDLLIQRRTSGSQIPRSRFNQTRREQSGGGGILEVL